MLQAGQPAPAFTLPDADMELFDFESLRGKDVVLFFYPKDDTPGCTLQATEFSDHEEEFARHHTVILGVSRDDRRLGKRVVLELEGSLFFVIHLMVSGRFRLADRATRLRWRPDATSLVTLVDIDPQNVGSLIRIDTDTRAEQVLAADVSAATSLQTGHDPGVITYSVDDGERSGVYTGRIATTP